MNIFNIFVSVATFYFLCMVIYKFYKLCKQVDEIQKFLIANIPSIEHDLDILRGNVTK